MLDDKLDIAQSSETGKTLQFPAWVGKKLVCSVCGEWLVLNGKDTPKECCKELYVSCDGCGADIHFSS